MATSSQNPLFLKSSAWCVTLWQDFPCTNSSHSISSVLPSIPACWILPGIVSKMQVYEFAGKKNDSWNCISQILTVLWCSRGADGSSGKGFSQALSFWVLLLGKKGHFGKLLVMGNAVISVALLLTQHWGQIKEMGVLVWESWGFPGEFWHFLLQSCSDHMPADETKPKIPAGICATVCSIPVLQEYCDARGVECSFKS